ncbi:putative LIM domain protein, partial [Trichinella nativa]
LFFFPFIEECSKCGESISSGKACTALDQTYHVDCFTCVKCGEGLAGKSFYAVDQKPYCEKDYLDTLEKCSACNAPITEKMLRATGKPYHPSCFTCSSCNRCLDGVPFTVDSNGLVHCVNCFHEKYAPRCAICSKPIVPEEGNQESVRIVALDRSFHVDCYRCEVRLWFEIDFQSRRARVLSTRQSYSLQRLQYQSCSSNDKLENNSNF